MREYRQRHRLAELGRFVAEVRRSPSIDKLATLCVAMIGRFGGVDKFTAEWKDALDAAKADPSRDRFCHNSMLALVKMIEAVSKRTDSSNLDELSDTELEEAIDRLVDEKIAQLIEEGQFA